MTMYTKEYIASVGMGLSLLTLSACNPTVTLETPDKPLRIDLNIKIEQEVRVKLEKDVDKMVKSNPNIF
jgi:hypothetical protein